MYAPTSNKGTKKSEVEQLKAMQWEGSHELAQTTQVIVRHSGVTFGAAKCHFMASLVTSSAHLLPPVGKIDRQWHIMMQATVAHGDTQQGARATRGGFKKPAEFEVEEEYEVDPPF